MKNDDLNDIKPANAVPEKKDNSKIAGWQKEHTVVKNIRLNKDNDKDILDKLSAQGNVQGYVKRLIREDIKKG